MVSVKIMRARSIAAYVFIWFAMVSGARAASAALDVIPPAGGAPIHMHVTQTSTGPDGPQTTTIDFVLRRTGASTAALQQNSEVYPLALDAQGSVHPGDAAAAATEAGFADLLDALSTAHGVMGVLGAGDVPGWSAYIPLQTRSAPPGAPVPAASQSPRPGPPSAPPVMLPMQAVAANGGVNIDGAVETTLTSQGSSGQFRSRSRGGGGFGGRGGFGGARGGGGGDDSGGAPRDSGGPPVILDVHVTGRIVAGSLAHLTITKTRRIVIDGLTYTNVATSTFDVAH
jgi:uncharacterized membrane protein YgcG